MDSLYSFQLFLQFLQFLVKSEFLSIYLVLVILMDMVREVVAQ